MGALTSDLKVLDCTHVIAGAYCSMVLADLKASDGAKVKIEPPGGESTRGPIGRGRAAAPPSAPSTSSTATSAPSRWTSRRRRRGPGGGSKLAETADIFVENYRPGSLDRMGLGYAELSKINPRLVYCSVSGFGLDGPYRNRGGFDLIAQAMSGIMSFVGEAGSETPCSTAVPISDLNAGAVRGRSASWRRSRAGTTTRAGASACVESSLLESALAYTLILGDGHVS